MPVTIPDTPMRRTTGNSSRDNVTAIVLELALETEGAHHPRRDEDEQGGQRAEADDHDPEERRGDAPRALPFVLLEQLAENGDEGRAERHVGDEGADEVRHLERDRECVDRSLDPEVPPHDDLAEEAEDARRRWRPRRSRSPRRDAWRAAARRAEAPLRSRGEHRQAAGSFLAASIVRRVPNIKQQKRRRDRRAPTGENLRYRSSAKTLFKRLEQAVQDGDREGAASHHRELVRLLDKAAASRAIHPNKAARKKSPGPAPARDEELAPTAQPVQVHA